jgi:hypothetical protein
MSQNGPALAHDAAGEAAHNCAMKQMLPISPDMRRALAEFRQAREVMKEAAHTVHHTCAGRQFAVAVATTDDAPHAEGGGYGTELGKEE